MHSWQIFGRRHLFDKSHRMQMQTWINEKKQPTVELRVSYVSLFKWFAEPGILV